VIWKRVRATGAVLNARVFGLVLGMGIVMTLVSGHIPLMQRVLAADASIVILPINRAKFLAGQRFDFRVEANSLSEKPTGWDVTINDTSAEAFFGTSSQITNSSPQPARNRRSET
jgi:hypothetical protein